ncbi:MAG: hypothetical protein ACD_48C00003G0002 [uncultured bacterium]|nr:MAG: hypothetical protein ACD_48C00003G0002 [uncultured bacterium]
MTYIQYQIELSKDDYATVHALAKERGVSVKKIISDAIRDSYNEDIVAKKKHQSTKELLSEIHHITRGISLKGLSIKKLAHEGHHY